MEAAKDGKFEGKNPFRDGKAMFDKLSKDEKERYKRIAHREKIAYLYKKMEYNAILKKEHTHPKSAFNFFVMENKNKTKEYPKGGLFQYCYKKWHKMDASARSKYVEKAEKDKESSTKKKYGFRIKNTQCS